WLKLSRYNIVSTHNANAPAAPLACELSREHDESDDYFPCNTALSCGMRSPASEPPREPIPLTPPREVQGAAVVRRPLPEAPPQVASIAPSKPAAIPVAPVSLPANALYVCVSENAGQRQQTTI